MNLVFYPKLNMWGMIPTQFWSLSLNLTMIFWNFWKYRIFSFEKNSPSRFHEIFASFPWKSVKVYWLARMGKILIKPNITTLFDPCQTFWWWVSENAHFSPKNLIPNRPHYSIGPYKPTQLNANQKKKEKFCKSKKFLSKQLLDARCYASTAH